MNKKLIVIIGTLLVVAIIVFYFIPKYIDYLDQDRANVYFTTRHILKGTVITADMVRIGDVSKRGLDLSAGGIIAAKDLKDYKNVVGRYAAYDMVPGEIIMQSKLARQDAADAGYMYSLGNACYAYPIRTDLESTGAGILKPGDYIDLYLLTKDKNIGSEFEDVVRAGTEFVVTSKKLRMLEILDLRNQTGSIADSGSSSGKTDLKVPRIIILKLNDDQIKELIKFESVASGAIKIAFRGRNPEVVYGDPQAVYNPVEGDKSYYPEALYLDGKVLQDKDIAEIEDNEDDINTDI